MWTRSVRRVFQLNGWINLWLRSLDSQIGVEHMTAPSMTRITSLTWILLVYFVANIGFAFSLDIKQKYQSNLMAFLQLDLGSRTFTWCVRPLHIHRWIIMSHNWVTEINKKLTGSTISTQIAFHQDMTSKITICISIRPMTAEPSQCLHLNPISILL